MLYRPLYISDRQFNIVAGAELICVVKAIGLLFRATSTSPTAMTVHSAASGTPSALFSYHVDRQW